MYLNITGQHNAFIFIYPYLYWDLYPKWQGLKKGGVHFSFFFKDFFGLSYIDLFVPGHEI